VIIFSVTADDFAEASEWAPPYFIRIRTDNDVMFAHTMVGLEREYEQAPPVYLPLCLESTAGSTLAAPPHTLELLRYRKGEDFLWLRVNSSASTWVNRQGVLGPPTQDEPVKFVLGWMADESERWVSTYLETNRANLPFQQSADGTARHVPLLVATEGSTLSIDPEDQSTLRFDVICFQESQGITTGESVWEIDHGRGTPVNFSGDSILALSIEPQRLVLSHLTPSSSPFETEIHLLNPTTNAQPLALFDGEDMEVFFVAPGLHALDPQNLELDAMARHLMGDEVAVSVTYSTPRSAFSGTVLECQKEGSRFALFPGSEDLFDGLVVVAHDLPGQTSLNLAFFDSHAQLLGVEERLIVNGKNLFQMNGFYSIYPQAAVVLLETEVKVLMQCLRGTPPYAKRGFVFESGPLPLDLDPEATLDPAEPWIIPPLQITAETEMRLFFFNPGDEVEPVAWALKDATGHLQVQQVISMEPRTPAFISIPNLDHGFNGYVEVVGNVMGTALFSTLEGVWAGSLPARQAPLREAWAIVEQACQGQPMPAKANALESRAIKPLLDYSLRLRVVNASSTQNTVFLTSFDQAGFLLSESTLVSSLPASGAAILELEPFHAQAATLRFHCTAPAVLSLTREPGSDSDVPFLQEWPWIHTAQP
jgi:hypothetical protein